MASSTSSKEKKARGVAGQKKKQPLEFVDQEFTDEHRTIEKDLAVAKLGTFKVFAADMTFIWREGQYRKVAEQARMTPLLESMRGRVFRADIGNRMSSCVNPKLLEKHLFNPDDDKPLKISQVVDLNRDAQFPVLHLQGKGFIEMQSGQHRMTVLKTLKPNVKDQWWIVTIYDESKCNSGVTADNTIELSKFGKEALRGNERTHQVAETEADTWLQIT